MLGRAGVQSVLDLGKLKAETSLVVESVQRGGRISRVSISEARFKIRVVRSYGRFETLAGAKMFVVEGNEVATERDATIR